MDFDDLLGPDPDIVELRGETRWEAIEELIGHLVVTGKIAAEHREEIAASVRKRESAMSTGLGFGIGLPHATTEWVSDVVRASGHSKKGLQFDSLDGKPVHVILLFLLPAGQPQKHLNTLANIALRLLRNDSVDGL